MLQAQRTALNCLNFRQNNFREHLDVFALLFGRLLLSHTFLSDNPEESTVNNVFRRNFFQVLYCRTFKRKTITIELII